MEILGWYYSSWGEACPWRQVCKAKRFQSKKLFAATLLSFTVGEGRISCPKVFLWSCRRLRLTRLPSVCKWIYVPSSLLKSLLSIMLKRTVNGVRARRRLSLKPSEGLWQVVALSDLDRSCSKPAATWLFQDSLKTFSAHGLKCLGQIDKCVRLFSYICLRTCLLCYGCFSSHTGFHKVKLWQWTIQDYSTRIDEQLYFLLCSCTGWW